MNKKLILGFGLLVAMILFTSFDSDRHCIHGESETVTKELSISNFDGLDIQGTMNVEVLQGEEYRVVAIGHPNIIEKINSEVVDGVWEIYLNGKCFSNYELKFNVKIPELSRLEISGTGNFLIHNFNDQKELSLAISGSGNIEMNNFSGCNFIKAAISGSGNVIFNEG